MIDNWKVYLHTIPKEITKYEHDLYYVGITKLEVNKRWCNGHGYMQEHNGRMTAFGYAIKKYGWDNIKHEVLFENLSSKEAKSKEMELILYYKSNCKKYHNPHYGYNMTDGGDSNNCKEYLSIPVSVFDLDGNYLDTYESISDASSDLGESRQTISKLMNREYKKFTVSNYIFLKVDDIPTSNDIIFYRKNIIDVFDIDGTYIDTFRSIRQVHNWLDVDRGSIYRSLNGEHTCCNKQFKYKYSDKNIESLEDLYRKVIYKYDLLGNFICEYESVSEAARDNNCSISNISHVLKGKQRHCKGFYYKYGDNKKNSIAPIKTQHKSVIQYDKNWNKIKVWDKISEANVYFGKPTTYPTISSVCKGRQKTAFGYRWKYLDEVL